MGVALTSRTTPKILPQLVHRVHSANGAPTTEGICLRNLAGFAATTFLLRCKGICFASTVIYSKHSISCFGFYCFQQLGKSASRSELTLMASTSLTNARFGHASAPAYPATGPHSPDLRQSLDRNPRRTATMTSLSFLIDADCVIDHFNPVAHVTQSLKKLEPTRARLERDLRHRTGKCVLFARRETQSSDAGGVSLRRDCSRSR